jgi:hypothetical protein
MPHQESNKPASGWFKLDLALSMILAAALLFAVTIEWALVLE